MKRLLSICFALIITLSLFTAACAEGIQFEQTDLPVTEEIYAPLVSETADELSEIELPTPEADDGQSTETDSSGESFAVESAPLDADDTDAGEQAVMAACAHKRMYVVWDGPSWYDPSYPGYVPFVPPGTVLPCLSPVSLPSGTVLLCLSPVYPLTI